MEDSGDVLEAGVVVSPNTGKDQPNSINRSQAHHQFGTKSWGVGIALITTTHATTKDVVDELRAHMIQNPFTVVVPGRGTTPQHESRPHLIVAGICEGPSALALASLCFVFPSTI